MSRSTETLFAKYLDAGDGVQFETWIRDYPEREAELRRLHADWGLLGAMRKKGVSFFKSGEHERPQPAPGLEAGKVIGDFRLVELIGQGGMGQVWKAEQVSLRRRVAVKFVRPERVTEKQLDFFAREARAGGRLAHPGIVGVHGYGEDDGIAWIAMELVEGCWTLRDFLDDLIRDGEVADDYDEQVARFIARLAQALHAAHEAGVIHRDLKPQNILIAPDEKPKVTDFGLARITDESALSETGDFAGTYFYMSPEQVAAKRMGIDHRTDIFSLGVVMYEMLALRRPFQGDTTHQVAQQIVLGDPPDMRVVRSKIPQDLAVICAKALEKNPERRYEAMAELAADIERHLSNEPIHAQPPTRVDRAIKWAKRNPTKSVAAVLVAVSLVVVSGLGLRITKQRDDLSAQTEELTAANTALGAKTEEAERRARDGLRLSLSQTYEDLVSDAEDLWPPHPAKIAALAAWVSDARALTGEFESRAVIAERDEWRKLALPQSQEERQADRESHPGFVELERGRGELVFRRRALAQRKDGHEAELPSVDWSMAPGDAARLGARARVLVDGERASFGNETFGLVLAERAIKLASDRERSEIAETLSQAYFALGRDDEALMMAHLAVDETTDRDRTAREAALARLETAVEEKCSSTGLAAEAERIKQLEQRVSDLEVGVGERRTWKFPEEMYEKTMARWLHGQLSELIAKLELLNSPGAGLFTENGVSHEHGWSVVRRLAFAERLKAEFDPGGEYALRWEEAQPEINAAYPGLSLAPQMGLVPMGADSESGLWEFWHVASGERPEGEPGQYFIVESTGIVLVLLPRGTFSRGAQMNAGGMNPDPHADSDESPVRRIQLEPFFISKYEMTQAQWERITAGNPSDFGPGGERSWRSREGHPIDGCHPVEQTTWAECRRVLGRLGLALPTETQWEYAARGATSTPWWTGAQKESVSEAANLKDSYMRRMGGSATRPFEEWLDDGYTMHAPVDAFLPNGFGLHNVIGNVWEWCDGAYAPYGPSTGVQSPVRGDDVRRLLRGGAFNSTVIQARSANRMGVAPGTATNSSGVRPARLITD